MPNHLYGFNKVYLNRVNVPFLDRIGQPEEMHRPWHFYYQMTTPL